MKSWPNYKVIEPPGDPGPEPYLIGAGPFRRNVAALILRAGSQGPEILLGERDDTPGAWQWPQGGVDKGESPDEALLREMGEEIGVQDLHILYRFPFLLRYRFPQSLRDEFHPNIGQDQLYYIATLPAAQVPDLSRAVADEFTRLRWTPLQYLLDGTVWFKAAVYREVARHLEQVLEAGQVRITAP